MIRVICTGNGTHRENFFGSFKLVRLVTATLDADRHLRSTPHDTDSWRQANGQPLKPSYPFICRRCQPVRETRMKAKTLRAELYRVHADGQLDLDISELPF